jgi:hypothetical protein
MPRDDFSSTTWLLMGLTGSTPGVLQLSDGRLSLVAHGSGALTLGQLRDLEGCTGMKGLTERLKNGEQVEIFNVPVDEIKSVDFPWYYFNGGMVIEVRTGRYRLSFLQPQNTKLPIAHHPENAAEARKSIVEIGNLLGDIGDGRTVGKAWRDALNSVIA